MNFLKKLFSGNKSSKKNTASLEKEIINKDTDLTKEIDSSANSESGTKKGLNAKVESIKEIESDVNINIGDSKIISDRTVNYEQSSNTFPLLRSGSESMKSITLPDGTVHEIPKGVRPVTLVIENVSILLGQDFGSGYQWVKNNQIEGQDLGKIINNIYQNVFNLHPNLAVGKLAVENNPNVDQLGCILEGGNFASSLIMLNQIWNKIYETLNTDSVVFIIPSEETFMFCDSKNIEAQKLLKKYATKIYANSKRPISNNLYSKSKVKEIQIVNEDEKSRS